MLSHTSAAKSCLYLDLWHYLFQNTGESPSMWTPSSGLLRLPSLLGAGAQTKVLQKEVQDVRRLLYCRMNKGRKCLENLNKPHIKNLHSFYKYDFPFLFHLLHFLYILVFCQVICVFIDFVGCLVFPWSNICFLFIAYHLYLYCIPHMGHTVAPDEQNGTLHRSLRHQCMNVWVNGVNGRLEKRYISLSPFTNRRGIKEHYLVHTGKSFPFPHMLSSNITRKTWMASFSRAAWQKKG